ncbi:hypothetical protein C0993_012372, partial [Termitomyces sp. T159_Od127]
HVLRSRDVIFEEGLPHKILPDEHNGLAVDLFEVLDILTVDKVGDASDPGHAPVAPSESAPILATVSVATSTATIPDPAIQCQPEPHLARLAAKSMLVTHNDPDNPEKPESKEETYASMLGTLAMCTMDFDKTWIPKLYLEAMQRPNLWKSPMDEEIQRMHEQKVWRLVEQLKRAHTMKNCWTFALKYGVEGHVIGCKARLIVK